MSTFAGFVFTSEETTRLHQSWVDAGFSPASDHPIHVTVIYGEKDISDFAGVVEAIPAQTLRGTIGGGLVQFDTPDGIAYASTVDVSGLGSYRADFRGRLVDIGDTHDFTPHATIQFGGIPGGIPGAVEVELRYLTLAQMAKTLRFGISLKENMWTTI